MRFVAPSRTVVSAALFDHPVFSGFPVHRELLDGGDWPVMADLNRRLRPLTHRCTGKPLSFVAQEGLTDDPIHYETRIFERGEIATRTENWHDLLNALVWNKFPAIKSALNARQAETIARVGTRQRTREQDALTQFDEAGAVLVLRDPALLPLWDAHDWSGLFLGQREAWRDGRIALEIFGHALLEHALRPEILLVAKALVFVGEDDFDLDARTADAILQTGCLGDPQHLRPLPVSGIPGWRGVTQDTAFYRDTPCFRPLRPGRLYAAPLSFAVPAQATE